MGRNDQQRVSDLDQSEVTLGDLLVSLRRQMRLNMHVKLPASVIAYDPLTEKAQVTIGWLEIVRNLQIPTANAELPQLPKIISVRVAWEDNGIGDGSRFPIPPLTTGTVSVYDRDLSTWLATGVPVDPMFSWNHQLKDSTFKPDIRPDTVPVIPVVNPLAHVIRASALLQLGGDAALDGVARLLDGTTPSAEMATYMNAVVTALDTIAAAVPVAIIPPVPPAIDLGVISSASVKVLSE
jgi:hypothetical protein